MARPQGTIEAAIGKVVLDCRRANQLQITLCEMELPSSWKEDIVLFLPPPGKWRRPTITDPATNTQQLLNSCKAYVKVIAPKPE